MFSNLCSFIKNNKLYALISVSVIVAITSFLINEIYDLDIWWHLAIGRDILRNWTIPFFDKYTAVGWGQPYHDSHWLFQVLVAVSDKCCGIIGVQLFMIAIWYCTLFFVWKSVNKWTKAYWAPILIFLAAITSIERFLPRPEIITFLMIAIFYYLLQNKKYLKISHYILFGLLQIIWANSHGLFIIGPFMAGCYLLVDLIEKFRGNDNSLKKTGILLAVVLASTLVVPWGISGWSYSLVIFSEAAAKSSVVIQSVGEMSSTFGDASRSGYAFWFYFTLLITSVIAVFSMFRYKKFVSARFLILLGLFLASLTGRRNIVLFGLIAAPFIAEFISSSESIDSRRFDIIKYLLPIPILLWAWFALSGNYYLKSEISSRFGFGATPSFFPHQLEGFLKRIKFNDQVFNSNTIGGFYLYQNYPGLIPLTDGRWEIYEPNIINIVQQASVSPGLMKSIIKKYNIKAYLLSHSSVEAQNLLPILYDDLSWKLVYWDYAVSFWLQRDDPKYIAANEIPVERLHLQPAARVDDYIMLELFLRGVKSKSYRLSNLDKILAYNWKPEYVLEQKALIQAESGNLKGAESSYRAILSYNPNNEMALNELAFLAYNKGKIKEAESLLEQIQRIKPRNIKAAQNLKFIQDKSNR